MKKTSFGTVSRRFLARRWHWAVRLWQRHRWLRRTIWIGLIASLFWVIISIAVTIGWYMSQSGKPYKFGVSFSLKQAQSMEIEPHAALEAMLQDLQFKHVRLMSYWDLHEPQRGQYDFSQLDWQMALAEKYGATVSLAIGVRQPRYPECHQPEWAGQLPYDQWRQALNDYLRAVVDRYKNNPALESYQLENEFFIRSFGTCQDYDRSRLVDEYKLVKELDPSHTLIVSLSNNAIGLPAGRPWPDEFGVSIYKRVFDTVWTHDYLEYPFPGWYYGVRAGWLALWSGRPLMVHEFQAEPWGPVDTKDMTIEEQNFSLDAKRLQGRFGYIKSSGIREVDLWGGEWWYWRKVKFGDNGPWDVIKAEIAKANQTQH